MIRTLPSIEQALDHFGEGLTPLPPGGTDPYDASPVFILASSWRAGSTALQRLVLSSPEVIIWGEPYRDCNYVQGFADSLKALVRLDPDSAEFSRARASEELATEWVATMSPNFSSLKAAHAAFFQTLYAEPAAALGRSRWGIKEVRLDIGHARYLKLLFPLARFVFLHRDPFAAYRSYRIFPTWYSRWPHGPVLSAAQFGEHWSRLTAGFVDEAASVDGMVVAYENLQAAPTVLAAQLGRHLNLDLNPRVLEEAVTGRGPRSPAGSLPAVPLPEVVALARATGDVAAILGYAPPSRPVR